MLNTAISFLHWQRLVCSELQSGGASFFYILRRFLRVKLNILHLPSLQFGSCAFLLLPTRELSLRLACASAACVIAVQKVRRPFHRHTRSNFNFESFKLQQVLQSDLCRAQNESRHYQNVRPLQPCTRRWLVALWQRVGAAGPCTF